jgi:hypothetical protein
MKTSASRIALLMILLFGLMWSFAGCGPRVQIKHQPVQFSEAPSPHGEDRFPNWQIPPHELEGHIYHKVLVAGHWKFVQGKRTARGMSGADKVTLFIPEIQKDLSLKWKVVPRGDLDGLNNSPRREIAAYQIQRLFLEPEDYVVPFSVVSCSPLDRYIKHMGPAKPSVEGTNCVLGNSSVWLKDVTIPEVLYEESRFLKEPNYAYFLSNLNLLTYLIAHRDAREGNFLVSKDDKRRQAFSIDNGESLGHFPYNFFVQNWDVIILPALRRDSIDRLRKLQRDDLDFLGVVAQLEKDKNGMLMPVTPGVNLDPKKGARIHEGTVQLGLTKSEIDDVWERIESLIADVDSGKIPVF